MGRIENAYAAKFRALLARVGGRKLEKGALWLLEKARDDARNSTASQALETVYQRTSQRIRPFAKTLPHPEPIVFVCDVGLGGLARWLRGAGYMAYWRDGVPDVELIEEARTRSAILLTTDSGMMERRVLRDGHV